MSEGVGGMSGKPVASGAGPVRNAYGALAVAILAIFPQLVLFLFAVITPVSFGYFHSSFSGFLQFAVEPNILRIYTLPLLVVAAITAFIPLRGPQDYFGGVALIALALFAFYASSDLPGMRGFQFGPGTAPRLFAGLMLMLGAGVTITGMLLPGAGLERYHLRGPFFVTVSILFFAGTIRPLGLIIAAFATFMIAALGSPEQRWLQTFIIGVAITVFCCFLFPYVLGLPFQMKPRFMLQ
jgi:hypothetical protein